MAYAAPTITEAGMSIPTYSDIINALIDDAKAIYGQDIYLGIDSQDYQFLSAIASKINDTMQLLQLVYNNRSPASATSAALSGIVKLNGIARKTGSYSTCPVILTGTPFTQISNGAVQDITGYNWSLPSVITIGTSGTVTVTATCQVTGPIAANPGDINKIITPTYGWSSVTNEDSATLGANIETDAQLRSRQSVSVSLTSMTVLDALRSAIAAISSVTRSKVYENDTNATNADGIQAHSIAAVVEGGANADIAEVIFRKKAPCVSTQGTTSVNIIDAYNQTNTIRFYRPSNIDVDVVINVKKLSGYTDQTTADIKTKVTELLNALTIGDDVAISSLWGSALSAMTSLASPSFSITSLTAAKHGQAQGTIDIAIAFNEVVRGNINYITVNVS